jgi:hypothetical protein
MLSKCLAPYGTSLAELTIAIVDCVICQVAEKTFLSNTKGKQVGTPTLPTAISLKSSSSRRATLVYNLFLNETMLLAFNL